MITKRDPDSEFWTAAREATERVNQWPEWKKRLYEIGPLPEPTPITYRAPLPERPKPTLFDGQIRIPVHPIPVPRVALIDLSHFEPAPKVKTTITVPVTWAARIHLRATWPILDIGYGSWHAVQDDQKPELQGFLNHMSKCGVDRNTRVSINVQYRKWAVQARRQRSADGESASDRLLGFTNHGLNASEKVEPKEGTK